MMSLTFGLFTQVSGSGPLGPLVFFSFQNVCMFIFHVIETNSYCAAHFFFTLEKNTERSVCVIFF